MLVLMTDFGPGGPYVGQMKAVLCRQAPGIPIIDLFNDAPRCDPRASAYLLAAYVSEFPAGSIFLAVIDPGVGTSQRRPLLMEADGRWFVGPDNGLFSIVARRAGICRCQEITWQPPQLSRSFHGRDLFAPVAAALARGERLPACDVECVAQDWPDDLAEVIYVDHFGNAMTGIRAQGVATGAVVQVAGQRLQHAPTFGAVGRGDAFWYENANGLLELAVNQGSAVEQLGLAVGSPVSIEPSH